MEPIIELLTVLLPVFYGLLTAAYVVVFVREEPGLARTLGWPLTGTLALHVLYVVLRIIRYEHIPLATVFESLTMIGLSLTFVYWIIERVVRTRNTGMFVLGLAFVFQSVSSAFIQHGVAVKPLLRSPLFGVHTTAAVIGYTAFALSAVYGALYLLLYHELKVSRFGIIYGRLPPLDTLVRMHERAALVGIASLTVAILIGMIWLPRAFGWVLADPKVLLTLLIWVLYVCVVAGHRFGWGSRTHLIYASIVGFILLVFSTLAVNLWLRSFHVFT